MFDFYSLGCLILVVIFLFLLYLAFSWHFPKNYWVMQKFNGPKPAPIFGHALQLPRTLQGMSEQANLWASSYKSPAVIKVGPEYIVALYDANHIEALLRSTTNITKSQDYHLIECWFGKGLLTSSGHKWHSRRKLLTPAFHFQILRDFVPVFNEHAICLVEKLGELRKSSRFPVDVMQPIILCTLDVICETAMGVQMQALARADSPYVNAVNGFTDIVSVRAMTPWLWNDFIFYNFTSNGRKLKKHLNVLQSFTRQVILERLQDDGQDLNKSSEDNERRNKKRLAFMDLLIESHKSGDMTLEDIREEVDTFMFEGHETTATGIMWTLYCLGRDLECQERVFAEIMHVFGPNELLDVKPEDLSRLTYMEACFKEAQRIYPSVPLISRVIEEPLKLDEHHTLPPGVTASAFFPQLHRDPERFRDPLKFDPDRFFENSDNKHPFEYVPFSAGPRNCIGQKFAFMESKVMLCHLLRNFEFVAVQKEEDMKPIIQFVYRPANGVLLKILPRDRDERMAG